LLFFIFKTQEALAFFGVIHKRLLPLMEDVVAFFFPTKQVRFFAREGRDAFACFDLVINKLMSGPLSFA